MAPQPPVQPRASAAGAGWVPHVATLAPAALLSVDLTGLRTRFGLSWGRRLVVQAVGGASSGAARDWLMEWRRGLGQRKSAPGPLPAQPRTGTAEPLVSSLSPQGFFPVSARAASDRVPSSLCSAIRLLSSTSLPSRCSPAGAAMRLIQNMCTIAEYPAPGSTAADCCLGAAGRRLVKIAVVGASGVGKTGESKRGTRLAEGRDGTGRGDPGPDWR